MGCSETNVFEWVCDFKKSVLYCLVANWIINYILKSECSVRFDIHQGTDDIMLRVVDWNTCKIRILDGFAQPQIWITYTQINLKRDLYIISVMWVGSFEFKIGQNECNRLFFFIDLRFEPQIIFLSSIMPMYLTSEDNVIGIPWKWVGGRSDLFLPKKYIYKFFWDYFD